MKFLFNLVLFCFVQFALIPGIALVQAKIAGYLQGNAEFLPLNFLPVSAMPTNVHRQFSQGPESPTILALFNV